MVDGDHNSKYFHTSATSRRRNNLITQLHDNNGRLVEWGSGLEEVMVNYFKDLFATAASDWTAVTSNVQPRVSYDQNIELVKEVTEEEVKKAMFQMHPDKSPGPDGMTPGFFQRCWHIVGRDVFRLVQEFFVTGSFPTSLNATNVVLIPKKKNPRSMGDLRPISLCNVLYKVISKVLANRLKVVLPYVISDTQSAFLQGRLISDNIMIAYEVMHYLKRKTRGRDGHMALKLDMSKAYDRLEWGYIRAILLKMGRCWDVELIRDIFDSRDQQLILSIQLSSTSDIDSWAWKFDSQGVYTVKSAYRRLRELKAAAVDHSNAGFWRKLWDLKIPPKISNFLWRAATNTLPTCVQLQHRHVPISRVCSRCNLEDETTMHALVTCPHSRACWNRSGANLQATDAAGFFDWLLVVFEKESVATLEEVAVLSWSIWKSRNEFIWQNKTSSAAAIVFSARTVLEQYKFAQTRKGLSLSSHLDGGKNIEHWTTPVLNCIKVNVDGAIFENEERFGMGAIARDSAGIFVAAFNTSFFGVVHSGMAEIVGIKEALSWIKRFPWPQVVLETDSLLCVQSILSNAILPSQFGYIVNDCRVLLSAISNVTLRFVKRSANKAAHCIARSSCFSSGRDLQWTDCPAEVQSIVMGEISY
uniref:Reverse transcriptase domain-containing protein n=1 Tax=Cannabis sativa TaxID=3483 RepID=A0A803P6B0_CANSA